MHARVEAATEHAAEVAKEANKPLEHKLKLQQGVDAMLTIKTRTVSWCAFGEGLSVADSLCMHAHAHKSLLERVYCSQIMLDQVLVVE